MTEEHLPTYQGRDDLDPRLVPVRREQWAHELADLRLGYAMLDAWNAGATIKEISRTARKPEKWVTAEIEDLVSDPPPRVEGRLGRRPLEVIYMHLVGEIDREQLIDELVAWPYEPYPEMGPYDEYEPDAPGSYQEVTYAESSKLLSASELSEIGRRRLAAGS